MNIMKWLRGVIVLMFVFLLMACGDNSSGPTTVKSVGQITVDGTLNLSKAIDGGHYNSVHKDISVTNFGFFAEKSKRDKAMVLISFGREISSTNAMAEMRDRGFRPAKFDELLAYGFVLSKVMLVYDLVHPNYGIVCLGQPVKIGDNFKAPIFTKEWTLTLSTWDGDWTSDTRFLAVQK